MCVCARVYVYACVHAHNHVCVWECECGCVHVCVFAYISSELVPDGSIWFQSQGVEWHSFSHTDITRPDHL